MAQSCSGVAERLIGAGYLGKPALRPAPIGMRFSSGPLESSAHEIALEPRPRREIECRKGVGHEFAVKDTSGTGVSIHASRRCRFACFRSGFPFIVVLVSSLRLLISVVLVALLAVLVGAPFYFSSPTVEGTIAADQQAAGNPALQSESQPAPAYQPGGSADGRATLVQPVIFPVNSRGKLLGHVRAKAGTEVEVLGDNGAEVVVRLANSSVRVPRQAVASLTPAQEEAEPGLVENARTAGERIIEYWFPGSTTTLRVPAE